MSSQKRRGSVDATLTVLDNKKKALESSRLRLVNEIEQIDRSLKEIQAEYRKIVNESRPVFTLPTEVTCQIFKLLVASQSFPVGDLYKPPEKSSLPEVVISHVCKDWREVSLNYPQLWTRFFFCSRSVQSMHNPIHRLDVYTTRSGSQNLELFFDFVTEGPTNPSEREAEAVLLNMAIKQHKRWEIVTLLYPDLDIETRFPDLIMASAPNLKYFSYSPWGFTQAGRLPTFFEGGTPKLRYLLLQTLPFKIPSFSSITTLRIDSESHFYQDIYSIGTPVSYPWKTFLEILSIPSLTNLSLDGDIIGQPEPGSTHVIAMNNLKHLRYSRQDYMTHILPFIRAPLLETLLIRFDQPTIYYKEKPENLFGIPTEAYFFPSLQTLILIDSTSSHSDDSMRRLMQMTRNVESILLSDEVNVNLFDDLQVNGLLNDESWPKLTSITANLRSVEALTGFLLSRPRGTVTVRLFCETVRIMETLFPNDYKEIKKHCNLKILKAEVEENAIMPLLWPPGVDCPEYASRDDSFHK